MTEESIRNIKMMVMVALIYEITLNFDDALKPQVQEYFKKIVEKHKDRFDRD